jgi:dihydrofolate reductase
MPKYVVSSTLGDPVWSNSTVLRGDVVDEVSRLKQELDGEIVVYGSGTLVRALMEHDLVDELRLVVLPGRVGGGRAAVRRDQRREADAPARQPDRR